MSIQRYVILALPALAVWFLMTGCFTQLYRPSVNGPPEAISEATLYDRYDSSAIDTTFTKEDRFGESYPGGYDYYDQYNQYDRWDSWGRPRIGTRWGFDFYNYSPPYYWGYYGWEDYYGYPWWYSWDGGYWHDYHGTPGTPGEPPSKRPYGRRDSGEQPNPPTVSPPPTPAPSHVAPPATPAPSRPPEKAKKADGQRDFGRRKR